VKCRLAFAGLACLSILPVIAAGAAPKRDIVAFNASVRVEVDAAGKPVKVEAPADLPEAIRGFIEKRVASWQYTPAKQDGVLASAVTYVRVGTCAVPVAEGYRLGLDFKGNGPAIIDAGPWFIPPPNYPQDAVRAGVDGVFIVSFAIQADGSTRVIAIEPTAETGARYAKSFRKALTQWIEGLQYRPEQVNGMAVSTTMRFPVEFSVSGPARAMKPSESPGGLVDSALARHANDLELRALASTECAVAAMPAGPLPIAQNSPINITPVPAG
jgi:hypothetical protein